MNHPFLYWACKNDIAVIVSWIVDRIIMSRIWFLAITQTFRRCDGREKIIGQRIPGQKMDIICLAVAFHTRHLWWNHLEMDWIMELIRFQL
jgi:hypothetical protein